MPTPKAEKTTKPRKAPAKKKVAAQEPTVIRPSHEQIAHRAHQLWIERGRDHGKHEEDWFRAEQELMKAS
jgi:hypothetical protein